MVHQPWQSLLILVAVTSICATRSFNFTKRCFVEGDSQVIWNVTFTDDKPPNLTNPNIVMETKGRTYREPWKSLEKCLRGKNWMQCKIDKSPIRHRYHLRIVKKSSQSFEYLMRESPGKGHYQEGFLCRPNHDKDKKFVKNLILSNVTSHGVDVSWTFYKWDIDMAYLRKVSVYVLDVKNKVHSKLVFLMFDDTPMYFVRHIGGLLPCTQYNIQVEGHYDIYQNRELKIPFTTNCSGVKARSQMTSMEVSADKVVIPVVCCLLLVVVVSMFAYQVLIKSRRRHHLAATSEDIVDIHDIGL